MANSRAIVGNATLTIEPSNVDIKVNRPIDTSAGERALANIADAAFYNKSITVEDGQTVPIDALMSELAQHVTDENFMQVTLNINGGIESDGTTLSLETNLARTIAALKTPVISSVGHETDNTLADFVADRRAATPTAAAELATPITLAQIQSRLQELQVRQLTRIQQIIATQKQRLNRMTEHVIFKQPDRLYTGYNQRVDQAARLLVQLTHQRLINGK
ncbi:hypothetical protein Pfo_031536 [Paulownia fortunei]|nr:hypothetical protein Pfo_031536 [Paulownia fortunei]